MTLCSDNDHDLKAIFDRMKKDLVSNAEFNLFSFGNIFWKTGKFDNAEKYYRR
jgi:hypothetical protein